MSHLPESARIRKVTNIETDEDGNEVSRETVDVPAQYGWKLIDKESGIDRWVNADDERTDSVVKRLFEGREEGMGPSHTLEKVSADGETLWGPSDI